MKLIPYRLNKNSHNPKIFFETYFPIRSKLEKIYGEEYLKYDPLERIFSLTDPKGKTILDLGCGSKETHEETFSSKVYEPWLSRALHELGANVIGIDLGSLEDERFTGYQINLTKENSLNFLKTNSIDIAIASSFFDSPALNHNYKSGPETFKILLPQLERIVKNDGYFIFDKLNSGY